MLYTNSISIDSLSSQSKILVALKSSLPKVAPKFITFRQNHTFYGRNFTVVYAYSQNAPGSGVIQLIICSHLPKDSILDRLSVPLIAVFQNRQ